MKNQTTIKLVSTERLTPKKERIMVLINDSKYLGYIITIGENCNKKYVQCLRKLENKNQANFNLKIELENYINTL